MNINYLNIFLYSYIFLLISIFSINIFLGVAVIPTIFNSELILNREILSKFEEGLLMTDIFIKLKYLFIILVIFIFIFEFFIKWKNFKSDKITMVASFVIISTSLLFIGYYIPSILEMQNLGEIMTNSQNFINLHQASEFNFKILSILLLILIYKNIEYFILLKR